MDRNFKRATFYCNLTTGEITESHREAVEWYRNGDEVAVLLKQHGDFCEKTRWTF